MLRFKILKIIVSVLIFLILALMMFFFFEGDYENEEDKIAVLDQIPENRRLLMKNPVINLGASSLSADQMEVFTDRSKPGYEEQVFTNFSLTHSTSGEKLTVTGGRAVIAKQTPSRPFQKIVMTGNVKCQTEGGVYIKSEKFFLRFNGLLRSESSVEFGRDRATGTAKKFTYNTETGIMVLSGDVQFTSPPDEGSTADELVFTTGTFRYDLESGAFNTTGRFDMKRGAEYLRADRMEGEFESGGRNLKSLRAVGKANLCYKGQEGKEPETAEKADRDLFNLNGYKVIKSPVIEFLFSGDEKGSLRGIRTAPRSLMMLYEKAPKGKPEMTVSSEKFMIDISADTGFIEGFEAEKNVKITQMIRSEEDKEPHEREIKCGRFIAEAADAGGEFDKIYFRNGIIIEELDQKIIGKEGIYSSTTSRLVIKGNPILKHTSGASAAENMEFDITDSALHLSGHVVSKLIDMQSRGNVFRETDELFINAGEMTHYTTMGKSSYKNNVKVYQDKSHMFSDALEIFHSDNSFVATGKVKGRIFRQESKHVKDDKNEPIRFKGDRVEVRESESIMIVEKGAEIIRSVKEKIKADYIEYGFGESFSETRYVKARGKVSFAQSPYSGNSEKLLYDYEKKRINLKGKRVLLYKNGNLVMVARELTFSPSGDIIQSRSIPGERLRAVWKPEEAK